MNITSRCLSSIIPMFIMLGLATGGLVLFFQYQEIYWGLSEEVSDTAITTSEFIDTASIDEMIKTTTTSTKVTSEQDWTVKTINRIVESSNILRINIISVSDKSTLLSFGPDEDKPTILPDQPITSEPLVIQTPASDQQTSTLQAFVTIPGYEDKYILMTEISAEPLTNHKKHTYDELLVYLLTSAAVGALCSLLIAVIIIRSIRDLTKAAEQAASGDYNIQQLRTCPIREINDLWNTFLTAVSVLKGVVTSSRRQLLDLELLRSEDDLIRTLSNSYQPSRKLKQGSLEIAVTAISDDSSDMIADLFENDGTLYAITGSVSPNDTGLRTALSASSLLDYVSRHLTSEPITTIIKDVTTIFDVVSLKVIAYNPDNQEIEVHDYEQMTDLSQTNQLALPDRPTLFHDISSSLGERLDVFVKSFSNSSCDELIDNILTIASDSEEQQHGAVIIIAPTN